MAVEVLAVRLGRDSTEHAWNPLAWCYIDDSAPFVYLKFSVAGGLPIDFEQRDESGGIVARACRRPDLSPGTWGHVNLAGRISRRRQYGRVSILLSCGVRLRLYVVPTAILSAEDIVRMIDDIAVETRLSVGWDPSSWRDDDERVHTGATMRGMVAANTLAQRIGKEMQAAAALRRQPFRTVMPNSVGRRLTGADGSAWSAQTPESAFVSHWAMARVKRLSIEIGRLERSATELRFRTAGQPRPRALQLQRHADELDGTRRELVILRQRVAAFLDALELVSPTTLGPSLQRDHRLRQLADAFTPERTALPAVKSGRLSEFPFVLLNQLMEVWGFVWMVRQLRAVGFVDCEAEFDEVSLSWARYRFDRGDTTLRVDYEPGPWVLRQKVDSSPIKRSQDIEKWARRELQPDRKLPLYATTQSASPDYTIRVDRGGDAMLLIGDACLATPEDHRSAHAGDDRSRAKPVKVQHYRDTIRWWRQNDEVVRCGPLGGFVLYPGPQAGWTKDEVNRHAPDITLIAPHPSCSDGLAERQFMEFLRVNGIDLDLAGLEPLP